jgi:hypothetical protein
LHRRRPALHQAGGEPLVSIACGTCRAPQLASRARRRIQEAPIPDRYPSGQREIVDAFFAVARGGDFEVLVAVLDREIVLRSIASRCRDRPSSEARRQVAAQALLLADSSRIANGTEPGCTDE